MATNRPDLEAVLAKVEALLSHTAYKGNSDEAGLSPEELAQRVAHATRLLAQFDMTIEDVGQLKADPRTAVNKSSAMASTTQGKPDGWKADLLMMVARAFDCKVIRTWDYEETKSGRTRHVQHYSMVGFKHDLDAAKYAFSFLVNEIASQGKAYARTGWDEIKSNAKEWGTTTHEAERIYVMDHGSHPLKQELYFIKGATQTINNALYKDHIERTAEQKAAADQNPYALVISKSDELDDFIGREQYGDRWESIKAERAATRARWEAEAEAERIARENETPLERKRREMAEERERKREERNARRRTGRTRYAKDNTDYTALGAGREAGRRISIRPGIGGHDAK